MNNVCKINAKKKPPLGGSGLKYREKSIWRQKCNPRKNHSLFHFDESVIQSSTFSSGSDTVSSKL